MRVFPEKTISLADVYASTDLTVTHLKRSVNALTFQGHIQETQEHIQDNAQYFRQQAFLERTASLIGRRTATIKKSQ